MKAPVQAGLRLTLLGQALIGHDLRAKPWPDFAALAALCRRAAVTFTDLETAIETPLADPPTRDGVFLHTAAPAVLDCLRALSVSLVAIANNHVWDLGTGGIVGLVSELDCRGLVHAGAGADLTAAAAPAYQRTQNGTAALVAVASGALRESAAAGARAGVNELRLDRDGLPKSAGLARVTTAIAEAARQADVVIAYHHNHVFENKPRSSSSAASRRGNITRGRERHPPRWQQAFAHRCIEAGAGLYVSHGAPHLHGIEIYQGRPIFYDLGNFIFQTATKPGFYDDEVWQSVIAECRFVGGRFQELRLVPLQLNPIGLAGPDDLETRGRPSFAHGPAADAILDRLATLSQPFGTTIECTSGTAMLRFS
jgi:poly-gamma-glutamate capsule biosynthesis protein CapA/YwtB (metallophosphatase superfamily)